MDNETHITIGRISACIAYDHRYTDTLRVTYDATAKRVHVVVTESSATGGRDSGSSSSTELSMPSFDEWTTENPAPKDVLDLVKRAVNDDRFNFKRYGKPTKRFTWSTLDGDKKGLSLVLVREALAYATWTPGDPDERVL